MGRGSRMTRWGRGGRLYVALAILSVLVGTLLLSCGIRMGSSSKSTASRGEIEAEDPSLFYSPWNWYGDGSAVQTTHLGAWLKFGWTGRSLRLRVDVSMADRAGMAPESYPVIGYSIDGGPYRILRLAR